MDDKVLEIKNAANIVEIIGESVPLKKAGKDYLGSCPFHTEKTPSFTVSAEKQMFFCFGCGTGGDVFEFLMKKDRLSFFDALKTLAGRYGIDIPKNSNESAYKYKPTLHPPRPKKHKSTWTPSQYSDPPELWQTKAAIFVEWAHGKLMENPAQLAYLQERGINKDTIVKFKLGWNPGEKGKDLFRSRESWGLPTEMKDGRKKKLWIPIGLVIPYIQTDIVIRLRIRRPEGKPKYYIIPGSSMVPMVTNPESKAQITIESELDAILLDQEAGDLAGSIALGSSSAKPDKQAHEILTKSLRILNALDYDQAGSKAHQWWEEHFQQNHRWPVPVGKDPGEAYQAGVNLREWILQGLPPVLTIRPFSPLIEEKGEQAEIDVFANSKPEPGAGIPEGIKALGQMLLKYPVRIYNSGNETKMIYNKEWAAANWETSKKISALIFADMEVFEYIQNHPEGMITGGNFWG